MRAGWVTVRADFRSWHRVRRWWTLRSRSVRSVCSLLTPVVRRGAIELGSQYFASAGLDVVAAASADLPSDQRSIARAPLHAWVTANAPVEADVVVIGGNGFCSVGVIEALEQDLGRPVVTANQALLWACLTRIGSSGTSSVTADCSGEIGVAPDQIALLRCPEPGRSPLLRRRALERGPRRLPS